MVEKVDAISSEAVDERNLRAVLVDVPTDPFELAARVSSLGDVAVLSTGAASASVSHLASRWSYVAAGALESSGNWLPFSSPAASSSWGVVPRWIGFLPYEHARELERAAYSQVDLREAPHHVSPAWRRYGAVVAIDHTSGRVFVVGDDAASIETLRREVVRPRAHASECSATLLPAHDHDEHQDRIREALSWIARGDLYQVNVARRLSLSLEGNALEAFARFTSQFPASYGAALLFSGEASLASTSPELFLRVSPEGRVVTSPIKGTRPRGSDADSDAALVRELDGDPKERAELTMVVDLERNDLGRVAKTGSVRLLGPPRVVTHRTLHHRVADVTAEPRPDVTLEQLLRATFPSGSVTGAPKVRAMELIAKLEAHRRGLYTGAIGYLAQDGSLVMSVAIRTLTVREGEGRYFTGGGIVSGSDPRRELEETEVKALHLLRAFQR